ncbi:NUDIX hydrolase [Granulicella cerasi]|uniref:NUDIX hydrolase n=1 Tax=Granulicella cerasi TaxID=741063 RepID=UPI0021E0483D|nr:NUDIX hydrolase [Granulicella cerasi]
MAKTSTPPAKKQAKKTARKPAAVTSNDKPLAGKTLRGKAKVLSSKNVYQGKVFWVTRDEVQEPGGVTATRDVIRHNGSVVILAVDTKSNPRDPGILLIRQYRHAADQFLLELPAGRIEKGEKLIPAAKRELIEETGYRAKKWSVHTKYFASPGFLSEAMHILLAEDLTLGEAKPEEDEKIELHMTPLSEVLRLIHAGKIHDGKTLIGVLLYASLRRK